MPLDSWACDGCGQQITNPLQGLLTWRQTEDFRGYDSQLVHKNIEGRSCDPGDRNGFTSSLEIEYVTGLEGQAWLLSLLSVGPLKRPDNRPRVDDFDSFVDVFRRLQVPWYEEARPHFDDEETHHHLADANEVYPYVPEVLERIANNAL